VLNIGHYFEYWFFAVVIHVVSNYKAILFDNVYWSNFILRTTGWIFRFQNRTKKCKQNQQNLGAKETQ